ncbi:hypothetical protein Gpo141_00001998 [Globisporangium polare]
MQNAYSMGSIMRQVAQIESLAVHNIVAADGILAYAVQAAETSKERFALDAVLALRVRSGVITAPNSNNNTGQSELLNKMSVVQGAIRSARATGRHQLRIGNGSATLQAAIASIIVFATLELASLLHANALLKCKSKLSGFHQLAFVFEHERLVVQGRL